MNRATKRIRITAVLLTIFSMLLLIGVMAGVDRRRGSGASTGGPGVRIGEATPEEAARNEIWTLFNSDCIPAGRDASAFDTNLCRALHPTTGDEARLESLLALREMSAVSFDPNDAGRIVGILRDGPADIRIGLIRGMIADSRLGIRVADLTADFDRMRQFLWGEEVPLE